MPLFNTFSNPQALDRDIAVGETELLQDVGESPGNGISSLVQDNTYTEDAAAGLDLGQGLDPVTQGDLFSSPIPLTQEEIDQNNLDSGYRVIDGRAVNLSGVPEIAREDFGEYDPFTYDWRSATDQSFRFLSPEDVGIPEGIEAVYGPTERDPFKKDWADASFRIPEGYEGEMLTGDEMNAVQEAQTFISNFAVEAGEQGLSIREYLAALKFSDPQMFNAISEQLNNFGGLWDRYGDQYKFQAALHDSQQLSVDPLAPDELVKNSIDLLRDYVNAGAISQADAAVLASDPAALVQWLTGGGPSGTGIAGAGGTDANADPDKFYYDDDVDKQNPMMIDPTTGLPVAYLAADEKVIDGQVIKIDKENGTITVVRDLPTAGDDKEETKVIVSQDGVDNEGRTLLYADWDTDEEYAFIYNTVTGKHEAAVLPGQFVDSQGRVLGDDGGTIVRDELDHGFSLFDDKPESDADGNIIKASGSGRADDGITAQDVPVTSDGTYDLVEDIARSPEDVANFYLGENPTLSLGEEFGSGWGNAGAEDDLTIFTSEVDLFPELNLPSIQRLVGYETLAGHGPFGGARKPVYKTFYVGSTSQIPSIVYKPSSIVKYGNKALSGPDKDWQHEQIRDLVPGLSGKGARPTRVIGATHNVWNFDMFGSQEVQELLFTELVNYSDITGVSLDSIYNTKHEDIGSYDSENPSATFDSEHFMKGDEDSGWGGFSDILQAFVEENALGSVGSNQDHLSQKNLEKFALFSTYVLRPMMARIESISNERESGLSFDQNLSIPSDYFSQHGGYEPAAYLDQGLSLGGPGDLIEDPGGFAGGIVGGMAGGGYIGGADGGMDDTIPASIDGGNPAALSSGEFVVPADVVSHLGDGNNANGASKLYQFLDQIRTVKTGSVDQPAPLDDGMMSGIMGDSYGR